MDTNRAHADVSDDDFQLIPSTGFSTEGKRSGLAYHLGLGSKTDRLFAALDGSRARWAGRELDLEVYSITDQATGRWIQLGVRGAHNQLITLRLPKHAGFPEAKAALLAWASDPAHTVCRVEAA